MMTVYVSAGLADFRHEIAPVRQVAELLRRHAAVPSEPAIQRCITPRGEPICTCCAYFLEWCL